MRSDITANCRQRGPVPRVQLMHPEGTIKPGVLYPAEFPSQLPPRSKTLARVVAAGRVAARQAAAQRFHPLCRRSVGEALRDDAALRLFLQRVVADRLGSAHSLLDIASFQCAGPRCPYAGIAICLELDADLHLVAFGLPKARLSCLGPVERALQVLDMMTDFMGDDIGLGEISGSAEATAQLLEKGRIDVDALVARTVEGPHGRLSRAATGLIVVGIGNHGRRPIGGPGLSKDLTPDLFRTSQDLGQEAPLLVWKGRLAAASAAAKHSAPAAQLSQGTIAEAQDDDADDAEARRHQRQQHTEPASQVKSTAASCTVFEVTAFRSVAKAHFALLPCRLQCFTIVTVAIAGRDRDSFAKGESIPMQLQGKTALVTGSTSGIGLAIARAFAFEGASLMINGFGDAEEIEELRRELETSSGSPVLYDGADLGDAAAIETMVRRCTHELRSPDIVVNNAGIQFVSPIEDFPPEKWDAIIRINLTAVFHTIRLSLPAMRERGWGRIINTASAHSVIASPNKSAYVAAKHGVAGLTKAVALEAARDGVTVNCISPGYVWTPLVENQIPDTMKARNLTREQVMNDVLLAAQPTKRFVTVDEVASLALYLASDSAASITGANLSMDGGWTAA